MTVKQHGGNSVLGVTANHSVTIEGLTISGGSLPNPVFPGGGIYNAGNLTIVNSIITGNKGGVGGGIFNHGALIISNSTLSGNTAYFAGGAIYNSGQDVTLDRSTIRGNSARMRGGIYNAVVNGHASFGLSNSTLNGNFANEAGGGIHNDGQFTLNNCTGVPDALADPTLELHNNNGAVIAANDDWKKTQQTEIEATGIPPGDDRESAIVQTLAPGAYTAIIRGKNNMTGVALVEAYQLSGITEATRTRQESITSSSTIAPLGVRFSD